VTRAAAARRRQSRATERPRGSRECGRRVYAIRATRTSRRRRVRRLAAGSAATAASTRGGAQERCNGDTRRRTSGRDRWTGDQRRSRPRESAGRKGKTSSGKPSMSARGAQHPGRKNRKVHGRNKKRTRLIASPLIPCHRRATGRRRRARVEICGASSASKGAAGNRRPSPAPKRRSRGASESVVRKIHRNAQARGSGGNLARKGGRAPG